MSLIDHDTLATPRGSRPNKFILEDEQAKRHLYCDPIFGILHYILFLFFFFFENNRASFNIFPLINITQKYY